MVRFISYLHATRLHTPLWAPLFVVLLACAARHVTYLCGSLFTHLLPCFACYGAAVLPMQRGVRGRGFCILHAWFHTCGMSPPCNILALSLLIAYRVVLAAAVFSVAWHITYLCFGGRRHCCCSRVFCICLLSCVLLCVCVPFLRGWGAHKSLAPRARTLLGVLGQATCNAQFLPRRDSIVRLILVSVLNFATSPNSGVNFLGGFSEVGKHNFSRYFLSRCVLFLV